jgi:hypothetical protein
MICSAKNKKRCGILLYQCRATRINGFKDMLVSVSISTDSNFGKKIISLSLSVGTPDWDCGMGLWDGIVHTFHSTRVLKGNTLVIQTISSSFDPSTVRWFVCPVHQNMKLL